MDERTQQDLRYLSDNPGCWKLVPPEKDNKLKRCAIAGLVEWRGPQRGWFITDVGIRALAEQEGT